MKKNTTLTPAYAPFLPLTPLEGDSQYVDVKQYIPYDQKSERQPKTIILDRHGNKTPFFGLQQIVPGRPWEELMQNDTRTRELTSEEFTEWARRCLWKATRPNGIYRNCPHAYTLSIYEDTRQRYEFECAAKTVYNQGRGMLFSMSKNVWPYYFSGDGHYSWCMDSCWKESNLMNRVEIATTIFLRKKEDPDWFNGRDDLTLRTFSYGTFLERFGFDRLARYHSGTIKPIEIRRFGTDEVKVYDFNEVTA